MLNNDNNNFIFILFIIAFIVALAASIYVDVFIVTSTDIPMWAKLFWFLRN